MYSTSSLFLKYNGNSFDLLTRKHRLKSVMRGAARRHPQSFLRCRTPMLRYTSKRKRLFSSNNAGTSQQGFPSSSSPQPPENRNFAPDGHYSTVKVHLPEFFKKSWFDSAGRPITSQDETGRFVNPWMSQSTNGVHTIQRLINWRLERLQREWSQYGILGMLLPTFLLRHRHHHLSIAAAASTTAYQSRQPNFPSKFADNEVAPKDTPSEEANVQNTLLSSAECLLDPTILRCTLIGHSTCLVQKGNLTILTDPIFSHRASPWQYTPIGVARDTAPAYCIADLPPSIDVCLISHDHYDHLDRNSVLHLQDRVGMWVVPLGIGTWLREKTDIPTDRIVELSWWDSVLLRRRQPPPQPSTSLSSPSCDGGWTIAERHSSVISHVAAPHCNDSYCNEDDEDKSRQRQPPRPHVPPKIGHCSGPPSAPRPAPAHQTPATRDQFWISACPTQHWSSRTFWDRCYRLWACFVVWLDHDQTFFFAGDTGRPEEFPLFEQIADFVGRPIDLAALPIGAYAPRFLNGHAHIDPHEAIQIHRTLQCRQSMAMHHGCFPLGEEPPEEPAQLLRQAAQKAGIHNFDVVPNGGFATVGPAPVPEGVLPSTMLLP